FGNFRTNDNTTVVTATRNAGSGTLQGTTVRTASGGLISYSALFHTVATTITIDFDGAGLIGATSSSIVLSATTATRLAFTTQPGNATAGAILPTQPVVKTQDQFGNDSTVGLPNNQSVTVSLLSGTGPLQGTATVK